VVPSKELDHGYYPYQTLWFENHPLVGGRGVEGILLGFYY